MRTKATDKSVRFKASSRKRQSVVTVAQTMAMLSIGLFGGSLIAFTLVSAYYEQQARAEEMRTSYVSLQKDITRREVERIVTSINDHRENIRPIAMAKAEERTRQAHAIAENIYQTFKATKPRREILEIILSALRPVRFEGEGYYFVIAADGRILLTAGLPEAEGRHSSSLPSQDQQAAVTSLIELAQQKGEGILEYEWSMPRDPGSAHQKVSYLKLFEPYNLIVGSGLYLADIEAGMKRDLMKEISNIRYDQNGYFFINDLKGNVLAHGYQPEMVGASNWDYTDSRGNKLFQDLRRVVEEPEGGFSYYWWRMPETGEERPKMAFAQAVPEWEWLIGTGVYLDRVEADIANMQAQLRNESIREISLILVVTIAIIILVYLLIGILFRPLRRDIGFFNECFALAAQRNVSIKEDEIKFTELLKIAENANAMLREKEQFLEKLQSDQAEKQELENRLVQAQKMEAMGTLAGGIAHDFNNVLGVILGYAEMAREKAASNSRIKKDLDKVLIAAHRAKDLTKQILAFSRQAKIEKTVINISPIIREGLKMLRSSIPSTISIVEDITKGKVTVLADPTQIHQILLNLCTNAYHAMEETGGVLSVTLRTRVIDSEEQQNHPNMAAGKYAELVIADTGRGISPELREKIFEPYFTTKEIGKGTGMGLAIIHGIVTECGGVVSVESTPGESTAFSVYLPIISEKMRPALEEIHTAPGGNERIMLVDDERPLAETGKDLLESLGYAVTVKTRSVEALATFESAPNDFDCIITDQTMPEMTGAELARKMIQIRPDIPIILCTGYSTLIDDKTAKDIGIKEFVLKPLTKGKIAKLIRKVLDGE